MDPDGELFERICEELEEGKSLNAICRQDGFPAQGTVHTWLEADEAKQERYARARRRQASTLADGILQTLSDARAGVIGADVARIEVDAKKWLASKMDRDKWGDAPATTNVNVGVAVSITPERQAELAAKKRAATERRLARAAEQRAIEG